MNDMTSLEIDDATQFIKVSLYDTRSSSTILKTTADTITSELVETIFNKVETSIEDQKYYKLVLVVTCSSDSRITRHCVRTLKSKEIVLNVESEIRKKQRIKYQNLTTSSRWFFKDVRSYPLELGEASDLTGDESSDDESEISLNDLSCIKQADRSGYLLRRSTMDPNLWQQRYCVLTDKLWCVNERLRIPKASCISLNGSTKVQNKALSLDCPGALVLNSSQGIHFFIAPSSSEQQSWMDDIVQKSALIADNDVIGMAEVIICDEVGTRSQRMQNGMSPFLNISSARRSLLTYSDSKNGKCPFISCESDHEICNGELPNKVLQISRYRTPQKFPRTYLRELQRCDSDIYEALSFVNSVNLYKELFRHDLGVAPELQWQAALQIFHDCLEGLLERAGVPLRTPHQTMSALPPEVVGTPHSCLDSIWTTDKYTSDVSSKNLWDTISAEITVKLHQTVHVHVKKCVRKERSASSFGDICSKGSSGGRGKKVFSKTPSAGGEDGSLRMLFGEGSGSLAPSAFTSSAGSSLWNWTSRTFGLVDNSVIEEDCDEAESVKYTDNTGQDVGYEEERVQRTSLSCSPLQCNSPDDPYSSPKSRGAYVTVKRSSRSHIGTEVEEMYYLRDRNIRPDSFLFDDLCEDLKRAMRAT